jgi:rhodanese-related sulfurtransferase
MNGFDRLRWFLLKRWIRVQFPQVRQLSTQELATWLKQSDRQPPVLLDVRTEPEYCVSHLPNAQRFDPEAQPFSDLPLDAPIVAYCSVGYRSSRLVDRLQKAGYPNVANLEGSIFQWANEGKPVYRQDQIVQQVHPYDHNWGRLLERKYRK